MNYCLANLGALCSFLSFLCRDSTHGAERRHEIKGATMIIASRKGIDLHGNKFEETVVRTGGESFRLEVRSDDPDDCFDEELSLQELFEYTKKTAIKPFVWTVIDCAPPS